MNYKFETTNYDNIESKSVWDLYVENFRDHLFDLTPTLGSILSAEEVPEVSEDPEVPPSKEGSAPSEK